MNWWNKMFKPRQDNFLRLLTEQAEYAVKGLDSLQTYTGGGNGESAQAVGKFEKEADAVRLVLIDELNRTFITPIDREDIFALSRAVDDILDYAYSTVDEMTVLRVSPNAHLQQMVGLLRDAAVEVHMAMKQLKAHPRVANDHAQRAKSIEN